MWTDSVTADGHVGRGDLLHHQRPGEVAEAGAADRLRERRPGQPELAHPAEDRAVEALGLVALDRPRRDHVAGELARGRLEQALLLGQGQARRPPSAQDGGGATHRG